MRQFLTALSVIISVILAVVTQACAIERPVLKGNVAISNPIITLGDLIDNAGQNAGEALFHAPEFGGQGTIQTWRIIEAARSLGLEGIDPRGLVTVRIERIGRQVSQNEMADLVAHEFMARAAIADRGRISVQLDANIGPFQFDVPVETALTLENLTHEPTTGRFDAQITVRGQGGRLRQAKVTGTLSELIDVIRLRRTIGRGEVLNASDVSVERISKTRASSDYAATLSEITGLAARRPLAEGGYIRLADVEKPRVIARNDPVTIILETPQMVLSVRGKALDGGAVGDIIDVQNVNSKRVVQVTILGSGKVSARLSGHRRSTTVSSITPPTATP